MRAANLAVLITLIAAAALGGVSLLGQINSLKTELANSRRELTGAKDRIARLERRLDGMTSPLDAQQPRPARDGAARAHDAAGSTPMELGREEIQLLRDYIKTPPAPPGAVPTISVGAAVPDALLLPLPPQISDKFPRLSGARFATDRNGAIIIVRRGSRFADAIITPH